MQPRIAKQRKPQDVPGASGDGAPAGGGVVPPRDNPLLLTEAREIAGFVGDWPDRLSPAQIGYLQYGKANWQADEIQRLAKTLDDECYAGRIKVAAYAVSDSDTVEIDVSGIAEQTLGASSNGLLGGVPMFIGEHGALVPPAFRTGSSRLRKSDGSPACYLLIASADLVDWWPCLQIPPSKLLAAWMQVPFEGTGSHTPILGRKVPKQWAVGVQRVAWDVANGLGDELSPSALHSGMQADSRIEYDKKYESYKLKHSGGITNNAKLKVATGTVGNWHALLKKELQKL